MFPPVNYTVIIIVNIFIVSNTISVNISTFFCILWEKINLINNSIIIIVIITIVTYTVKIGIFAFSWIIREGI